MRTLLAPFLLALPLSAFAQESTPTPLPFASDERPLFVAPASVADPGGADAMLFNPAGLGLDDGGEFTFLNADRFDKNEPGDGLALFWKTGGPFHLGMEWARPAEELDVTLFHFGTTMALGDQTALGAAYVSNLNLGDVRYDNWSAGFLTRPSRFFALGATVWNAQEDPIAPGLDLTARYAGGLAVRPLGNDRFTLSADVAKTDSQKGEDVRVSVRAMPFTGLSVYATADEADRWTAGLTVSFGNSDIGAQAISDPYGEEVIGLASRVAFREQRRLPVTRTGKSYARLSVGGALPDHSEDSFLGDEALTLPDVLMTLAEARKDPTIDGVLVRINGFGGGYATAQELRQGILDTRAAKKKVFCYFDSADLRMYYVAAACDKIAMNPAGIVSIEGLSSGLAYMKGTLDKIGVQVEVARVGPYKGAAEPYIQEEPSKETLEVANALLDGFYNQSIEGIAAGRALEPAQVKALIDGAFYPADKALEAKLVDYVFYPDEVEEKAKDFLGKSFSVLRGYGGIPSTDWGTPPRIAVVYASGAITEGESTSGGIFSDPVMGSSTIVRALREAKNDDSVKAVVLRVDSPGGSGFASDELWHEMLAVKKVKPVVVSMGDVAASGGYYISQSANEIYALPGTITGSIGVFFLKPNFQKLYEKYEYKRYDLSRGEYADMFTEARPFSEAEQKMADRLINDFYQDFIKKAAEGRGTTIEAIDAVGRGRVWLGDKALELKLVDKMGGLEQAIARAKELGKIPKRRRVEIVSLPSSRGFWEQVSSSNRQPDEIRALAKAMPFSEELAQAELANRIGPGVAAWFPLEFRDWRAVRAAKAEEAKKPSRRWWPLPQKKATPLESVE